MKVTTYLLKEFIAIEKLEIQEICESLSNVGLEIESCEEISIPKRVVIGKVVQKKPHADADKLSVCQVDVGHEVLQIVCGAKNVSEGQFVAVALVGARLEFDKKVMEIGPSKLRGVESFGMLCSSVELGLPKLCDGIMVLDESIGELILGKELGELDPFRGFLLDIALTPNRGDCLCVLGIARELKSIFGLSLKNQKEYLSTNQMGIGRKLQIALKSKVDSSLLYKMVDFNQKSIPLNILLALGWNGNIHQSIVQNFVSYVTYMTGVILNAYGVDHLYADQKNHEILWLCVQKNPQGFEEVYVDEKLCVIGVHHLAKQDLDSQHSIIFEASYIDPTHISQLLFENKDQPQDKEMVYKTTRGSNPNLSMGINFLSLLLDLHTDCFIYDGVQEVKQDRTCNVIRTKFSSIAGIIGYEIDREVISSILKQLDFYLELKTNDDSFSVVVPSYRHDMQTQQDLAEEILRLYGVDKIPSKAHMMQEQSKITPVYQEYQNQRDLIKRALSHGFVECIHYLFYQKEKLQRFGFEVLEDSKQLCNPITSELNTLRTSLLPAMLDSLARNQNFGYKSMRLCEIGSVYDAKRCEKTKIALMVNGLRQKEQYPYPKGEKWDFAAFVQTMGQILGAFELQAAHEEEIPCLLHPYQSAYVMHEGRKIGLVAKLHPIFAREMDLQHVFMCEVDVECLQRSHPLFKDFSRLPTSSRDLTILLDKKVAFGDIRRSVMRAKIAFLHDVFPLDLFVENEQSIALSIRLHIKSFETLTEEDIQAVSMQTLRILEEQYQARLKG